ncbi:hypothetical protein [Hyalangium rubrum]|uniref:Lipoprotein n=1 Tax=Hyalangium rubrum TaxID=3103134 RepID=A0ABU5H1P9_9BACT|nr:hypothetical protein [Hyalangium sp. s54d21]MDY7226707.1 hypothetical protein [Hyalangium sp. s54d21]
MTARPPLPLFSPRSLAALFTLSLATGCFPSEEAARETEIEQIPLHMERTQDALRFSWDGDMVHRVDVIQCESAPLQEHCACNGSLVWGLGAGETEKFHEVALAEPFIASPLQYGVTPGSDRKAYAPRPLVAGKTYLVQAVRVAPCEYGPNDCQKMVARGCQSIVW